MVISNTGLELIKQFEGLRLKSYKAVESEKYFTIGYGHYGRDVTEGMTITEEDATCFLIKDVHSAETSVNTLLKTYSLNQNQFDALVSFTFNCGASNLSKLTAKNTRTVEEIGKAIILYNKSGGKILKGLVKRRNAEYVLFFNGYTQSDRYPKYTGTSSRIDAVFRAIGVEEKYIGTVERRRPVAIANCIESYSGSYSQNIKLCNLAKRGDLLKPRGGA